jgi:hypothetical protein
MQPPFQPTPPTPRMVVSQTGTCAELCPAKPDMQHKRIDDLYPFTRSGLPTHTHVKKQMQETTNEVDLAVLRNRT